MDKLTDWLTAISEFWTQHPTVTALATSFSSIVSGSVVIKFLWNYWRRPIICARLHEKYRSIAEVPFGLNNTAYDATYLRLDQSGKLAWAACLHGPPFTQRDT
jgi:hypothetical protein